MSCQCTTFRSRIPDLDHFLPSNVTKVCTSVRHAHADGLHPQLSAEVDHGLHARDEGFSALQPKALGCSVLGGQELLKLLAPGQAVQDVQLLLLGVLLLRTQGGRETRGWACCWCLPVVRGAAPVNRLVVPPPQCWGGDSVCSCCSCCCACIQLRAQCGCGGSDSWAVHAMPGPTQPG